MSDGVGERKINTSIGPDSETALTLVTMPPSCEKSMGSELEGIWEGNFPELPLFEKNFPYSKKTSPIEKTSELKKLPQHFPDS